MLLLAAQMMPLITSLRYRAVGVQNLDAVKLGLGGHADHALAVALGRDGPGHVRPVAVVVLPGLVGLGIVDGRVAAHHLPVQFGVIGLDPGVDDGHLHSLAFRGVPSGRRLHAAHAPGISRDRGVVLEARNAGHDSTKGRKRRRLKAGAADSIH